MFIIGFFLPISCLIYHQQTLSQQHHVVSIILTHHCLKVKKVQLNDAFSLDIFPSLLRNKAMESVSLALMAPKFLHTPSLHHLEYIPENLLVQYQKFLPLHIHLEN
jgi:riboflavin transporter FmnP